ncbi:MAG TPA: hypothetical protein VF058_02630 [Actinomycetota bacterium]
MSGSDHGRGRPLGRLLLSGVAVVALTAAACADGSSGSQQGGTGDAGTGGESGDLTIVMDEYAFIPDTLTVSAGDEIEVTIVNDGNEPHELMIGMPTGGGPEWGTDLFGMMNPEVMSGEGYHMEGVGHMEGEEGEHGMGHGAEVELEPGGQVTLRMHVPEDATGEWEMGCYLGGHYEAGMHGTMVVQ